MKHASNNIMIIAAWSIIGKVIETMNINSCHSAKLTGLPTDHNGSATNNRMNKHMIIHCMYKVNSYLLRLDKHESK